MNGKSAIKNLVIAVADNAGSKLSKIRWFKKKSNTLYT